MTTIKATCPTCGEVSLTSEEVELWVDPTSQQDAFYAFTCPDCLCVVRKPADDRVVRLLRTGGVEVRDLAAPAVAKAPRFPWPPLVHDDLLDFHTLLARGDWFDDLLALVQRSGV
jgi:predicted RNA-binding Zn-ribbon protein involved in translation (DUF1610 family)